MDENNGPSIPLGGHRKRAARGMKMSVNLGEPIRHVTSDIAMDDEDDDDKHARDDLDNHDQMTRRDGTSSINTHLDSQSPPSAHEQPLTRSSALRSLRHRR